jgi:hypothetical protein
MGYHRKLIRIARIERMPKRPIARPSNVGKTRTITSITGSKRRMTIQDEIIKVQSNNKNKLIVLQKIKFDDTRNVEYRFGYYMLGVKKGARGRWVWGQFCLLVPAQDFRYLIRESVKRKWI